MGTMKIGAWEVAYASAAYTFQTNPRVINLPLENQLAITKIAEGKLPIAYGSGGTNPRVMIINGTTYGTSKRTYYRNLQEELTDVAIKRFWIEDDKYYEVLGQNIRETLQGERTNFIDYVGTLVAVNPYLQDATERTYVWTTTGDSKTILNDTTGGSTGAFTNPGNAPAFVTWKIVNTSGSNITQIEIGDTSDYASSPHKLIWSEATGLASGETLYLYPRYYLTEGTRGTFKFLDIATAIKSSAKFGSISLQGDQMPWILKEGTDQAFSMKLTGNDAAATVTASWHYSYTG